MINFHLAHYRSTIPLGQKYYEWKNINSKGKGIVSHVYNISNWHPRHWFLYGNNLDGGVKWGDFLFSQNREKKKKFHNNFKPRHLHDLP